MSRSRKHHPIGGITTAESEKRDKRVANRRLRRKTGEALNAGRDPLPVLREVSNPWSMAKDGRQYWPKRAARNPVAWRQFMTK